MVLRRWASCGSRKAIRRDTSSADSTTAADLGLGRIVKKTGDFVGRVLAERPAMADPRRPRLTGIHPVDKAQRLRGGAHLVAEPDSSESLGHVTSVTRSVEA